MSEFEVFVMILLFALFIVGIGMTLVGLDSYEEGIGYAGVVIIVISAVAFLIGISTIEEAQEKETDRHAKINYEELCAEFGGEYLALEGEEKTCVVESE